MLLSWLFSRSRSLFSYGVQEAFFLQSTNSLSTDLELNLFTVDDDSLSLEIWLPDFLSVALREADIAAELLAFAGEFTLVHINP